MTLKRFSLSLMFCLLAALPALAQNGSLLDKLQKFAGPADSLIQNDPQGNYFIEENGTVYFTDGTEAHGVIRFNLNENTCILFHPEDKMRPERICSKKIDHFSVRGKIFYAVTYKASSMAIGREKIFMEMLNHGPQDRFRLFYLRKQEVNTDRSFSQDPFKVNSAFFVMLPEWDKAHDIEDLRFMPFAKKMSGYLQDCPELSEKIKNKEEGYKVNMLSGAANYDVYFRVMQEYNACGS
jgi:hypothetical protein